MRSSRRRFVLAFKHGHYNDKGQFKPGVRYSVGKAGSLKELKESSHQYPPSREYPVTEYVKRVKQSPRTQKIEMISHDVMRSSIEDIKKKYKKLPIVVYHVLEDANYHTKNTMLTRAGLFRSFTDNKDYATPNNYSKGDKPFIKYRREGGKSWE